MNTIAQDFKYITEEIENLTMKHWLKTSIISHLSNSPYNHKEDDVRKYVNEYFINN